MKILIDNGHGIETIGKCSPDALKGLVNSPLYFKEYQWCREVANMVCDLLQAEGFDAQLLVPELKDIALAERVRRVNRFDAKDTLLISIHVNAAGSGNSWMNARGWSIYTSRGITEADILAECIYQSAKKTFKYPQTIRTNSNLSFGHDFEENFYILRNSRCPAVLIENFFQDNKEDVKYLKTNKGKAECAEVIVLGIKDYLKNKKK